MNKKQTVIPVMDNPNYGVRREGSGQYVYSPNLETEVVPNGKPENPIGEVYEMVGTSKDGVPIVRDVSGALWRLSERV